MSHRNTPGLDRLVRISGSNQREIRDGTQRGKMLDGLMRRAVLAESDRIVGKDVDDVQLHQRRQSNRRPAVVGEHHEARTIRDKTAVQRDTVQDRAHPVLTYAEMQVAAAPVAALETAAVLHVSES